MSRRSLSMIAGLILMLSGLALSLCDEAPAVEDLSAKKPVSIDAQVASLKLKDVGTFKDNLSTRTTIRFSGKLGEYEVRPGTDVLVQLDEGTRLFEFAPVGFNGEVIGGRGDDFPVFHYVRLEWNLNGAVRWTMYALAEKDGAGVRGSHECRQCTATRDATRHGGKRRR